MSTAPSFVTPLRYPGGKGRLGAWLADLIKHNGLDKGLYAEPYAGGAGAAMYLLVNNFVDRIAINDLDPMVHAFWWTVLNDAEGLIDKIISTPVTMETWHEQKEILEDHSRSTLTEIGFATFFLNRTNRSGIIKGGVIGGQRQTGNYLIDARYNQKQLITRIQRINALRTRIQLFNADALDFLKNNMANLDGNSLIYLDPPYYVKGSQLYRNHYKQHDHQEIAEAVMSIPSPWIVTYDNCSEIREIYLKANCVEFSLHYSTHLLRPKATEAMFYGNIDLHTPPTMRR